MNALASYWAAIQRLVKSFSNVQFKHVPRSYNKHEDALATLASQVDIHDEAIGMKVIRKTLQPTTKYFIPIYSIDEKDWQKPVIQNLL